MHLQIYLKHKEICFWQGKSHFPACFLFNIKKFKTFFFYIKPMNSRYFLVLDTTSPDNDPVKPRHHNQQKQRQYKDIHLNQKVRTI